MARALVIDDDIANGRLVERYLELAGHEVVRCSVGRRGLERALAEPPDLVVLDVMMPGMDGFEICQRLRANAATRDLPVIFLSARGDLRDRVAGLDHGAVDYLVKPVEPEDLLARVRSALRTKSLQDQLRAANEQLRDADRNRHELVSMLAHDIRGMIGAVASAVEMTRLDLADVPPRDSHRFLGIAERNASELVELTTNLLDTYRLDEGRLRTHSEPVSLGPVAAAVVDRLDAQAIQRDVRLEIVGDPAEKVYADRALLNRVLLNLVANAVKFSPAGGRVVIDLEAPLVSPGGRSGSVVAVRDQGPGISPAEREHLFERFTPLALPKGGRPVGSGLGLAFCRKALQLMGGEIWVDSEVGKGSTLAFTLPRISEIDAGQDSNA